MSRDGSVVAIRAELANVTVVRADGRRVDLGKPGGLRFRARLLLYKLRTRKERAHG